MTTNQRYRGTVKAFDVFGGTGTIMLPDGREVLVRYSAIRGAGIRKLPEGTVVSFQLEETRRGLCAVCVQTE
jgi:CspA family cold shock protein